MIKLRKASCHKCRALHWRKGLYNIDPLEYWCDLGYPINHEPFKAPRPAEPCPRPLTYKQFDESPKWKNA